MDSPNSQQQLTFPLDPASVQVLVAALSPYFNASLVKQILAGTAIVLSPSSGLGIVTVTNGGVQSLLVGAGLTISGSTGNITVTVSDATLATSDITTNNASTSKHGFVPKLPNDATKYYDGTGAFSIPSGGGGGGGSLLATSGNDVSRTLATASGTQTIAHGLGTTPTKIRIMARAFESSSGFFCGSDGVFTSLNSTASSVYYWYIAPTTAGSSVGSPITLYPDGTGTGGQHAGITVDATNIYIAWVKVGSPAATPISFVWEASA